MYFVELYKIILHDMTALFTWGKRDVYAVAHAENFRGGASFVTIV